MFSDGRQRFSTTGFRFCGVVIALGFLVYIVASFGDIGMISNILIHEIKFRSNEEMKDDYDRITLEE